MTEGFHVASRVAGLAAPGEVLVSRTVKDLSVGSGVTFQDRGTHNLMGSAKKSAVDAAPHELDPALLIEVCAQLLAVRTLDRLIAAGCVGLRYSDGFVFQHLVPGPLPVTALAKRLQMTQQGASKTVLDLERRGYVERVQAPHDERVRLVTLTDLGWMAVNGARQARDALKNELRTMLGVSAAEQFTNSLRTLTKELGGFEMLRERRLLPK